MSVLLTSITLELEESALLAMSVQREAVHSTHVTPDIMQLCQEWLVVMFAQQVGGVNTSSS